jgi:hypothetical protein
MLSIAIRLVTRIHSSSYLLMLVLRGFRDYRALYLPRSSLLLNRSKGAMWALSLTSRACAVASFWISGIKEVDIVKATLVQISLRALSF